MTLAACGGQDLVAPQGTISIFVTDSSDSPTTTELDQAVVNGVIAVTVEVNPTPTEVRFYLDDPELSGAPISTDADQPFGHDPTARRRAHLDGGHREADWEE